MLLEAYRDIRDGEAALHLGELPPREAMEKLVGFTFDHFRENPWFIRLLATENIQRGAFVARAAGDPRAALAARRARSPRCSPPARRRASSARGVDPVQLYITIAGVSYFYLSNIHTLSVIFDAPLDRRTRRWPRGAPTPIEVVLGYLRPENPLAAK